MVQVREITIAEMRQLYIENVLDKIVQIAGRVYALSVKGQADSPDGYEVVWATIP